MGRQQPSHTSQRALPRRRTLHYLCIRRRPPRRRNGRRRNLSLRRRLLHQRDRELRSRSHCRIHNRQIRRLPNRRTSHRQRHHRAHAPRRGKNAPNNKRQELASRHQAQVNGCRRGREIRGYISYDGSISVRKGLVLSVPFCVGENAECAAE